MTVPKSFRGLDLGGTALPPAESGGEPWTSPEGIDIKPCNCAVSSSVSV